jgi:hypothetical protein
MRRRVVCPRSHPASLYLQTWILSGARSAPGLRISLWPRRNAVGRAEWASYSALRNLAIAIANRRTISATIVSDSHSGTSQPSG